MDKVSFFIIENRRLPILRTCDREAFARQIMDILGPALSLPRTKDCRFECFISGTEASYLPRNELAEHVLKELKFDPSFGNSASPFVNGKAVITAKSIQNLNDAREQQVYSAYMKTIKNNPELKDPTVL